MSANRRRNSFRHHLILTSATVTAVFAALVGASLFVPLVAQLDRPGVDPQVAGGIAEHVLYLHRNFWPVVLGSLVASAVSGMVLYQRMTAPLGRFVRIFREVGQGALPGAITLRRLDYLTEESEALNEMVAGLRTSAARREVALAQCQELIDDLESAIPEERVRERAVLSKLREALDGTA